jgi:hypothetical protein
MIHPFRAILWAKPNLRIEIGKQLQYAVRGGNDAKASPQQPE